MEWPDVHLDPLGGARFGYIHIRSGKSLNATRNVSLTPRVRTMLKSHQRIRRSVWIFTDGPGTGPLSLYTLEVKHKHLKESLRLAIDAVIHSFVRSAHHLVRLEPTLLRSCGRRPEQACGF